MTASTSQRWIRSSKANPCPVCGRTKDDDCQAREDGQEVNCHHPKDLSKGAILQGADGQTWAFTHDTADGRAGHFVLDKPRTGKASGATVLPFKPRPEARQPALPQPAPMPPEPPALARMEARPAAGSPYRYSETQRVVRTALPNDKKKFRCEHLAGDRWQPGKGPDPWPAFNQSAAIEAHGWILEPEGEKCAELAIAEGMVAISQPGHAHGVDQIRPRYEALRNGGALGVVYLADNDDTGQERAKQATEAAALAGLPIIVLDAGALWPGLPVGGSIDDAPGTAAEQIEVIEAAARVAHARMIEGPLAGEHLGEQEQEPPTYGELISATLQAIREANEDAEMEARAELKHRFRVSDEQIGTALFKSHSAEKVQKVAAIHDSVDMAQVEQLDYLMDGWILRGDVMLTYGSYGTGKTTLALAKLHAHVTGTNLLDRDTPCTPGRGLFIATDSGTGPLKKAMLDLRLDPDNSPLMAPGHPEQRIWVWGYEPGQGQTAWICDIHGVIRLEKFIQKYGITYVVIDSAKSVSSAAGWSYTSNESVAALLKYLREGVAQPHGCCIEFISHDGTAVGSHSGAKRWAEDPSMVCALTPAINPETNKFDGVIAEFKKDRAAHVDARRTLRFGLNDGRLELHPDIEVVSSCVDALLTILWEAHQRGSSSVSGRELKAEAVARFNRSHKTVENTLGKITGTGKGPKPSPVIRPRHGAYALAPAEIQKRMAGESPIPNRTLYLTGGVYSKPTAAQGVYVPPIQTPIGGIGGIGKPPFPPSGGSIGGTQTQGHNSGLPNPPPDGGSTPPNTITIGSTVAKWSRSEKRHIPGWIVLGIEGDQATVQRASGGGRLTVLLSALRMERQAS